MAATLVVLLAVAAAAPAAPGTVLAAPGTVLAAPGTVLAAPGTVLAAPGTVLAEDTTYKVTADTPLPTVSVNTVVEISTIAADEDTGAASVEADGGAWRCPPGCDCAAYSEGTTYTCSLPSGRLTFDEYGDGVTFKCEGGVFRCAEVPLAEGSARGALRATLGSVTLRDCALPAEPIACALARRGARNASKLLLQTPRTPLEPVHLRGLEDLQMLRITDLEGAPTELPLRALGAVPRLRQLTVNQGRLRLRAPLPAMSLLALELAEDQLTELPPRPFRALPHLRRLGLWANALSDLPEDTFEGLDELRELSLSQNRLTTLPATLLRRTPLLVRLDLYANPLRRLPAGLLAGLSRLEQVRLMDNSEGRTPNPEGMSLEPRAFADLPALQELDASNNALRALPADALAGARALRLLGLAGCALRRLPPALLAGLGALETLDLSQNLLADLPPGLFTDVRNLTRLDLDNNLFEVLPSSAFLGLRNLESLSLKRNRLTEIALDAFVGVPRLQLLSLAHNLLAFGAAERDGEYAQLDAQPSPFSAVPALRRLDLAHNRVAALLDDWRLVLVSLERLDLSWNRVSDLNYVNLNFLSSMVTVDLRHNNISTVMLGGESGGSAEFLLDDNPFECDCHAAALRDALARTARAPSAAAAAGPRLKAPAAACAAPPSLHGRPLPAVPDAELACALPAPLCPPSCRCLLHPGLFRLDCDTLPDRLPDPKMFRVEHLALRLRSVPSDARVIPAVHSLDLSTLNLTEAPAVAAGVEVDLTGNLLRRVPAELLTANTLRLAGNPLACGCAHAADVLAVKGAGAERVLDYALLRCADGQPLREKRAEELCRERDAVVLGVSLLCAAALALWVCYLLRRLGGNVLCWVLGCGCCSPDDEDDLDKTYHAFLSFAHEDTALAQELVAALEAPPHSLRVCVHYRDWGVGDLILEQIVASVESSRRTVVVLSRAFLSSHWMEQEFHLAQQRALADGRARVIVVLVGDVLTDPRLGDKLRLHLATTTYLHRDDARFLPKLVAALRPRRPPLLRLLRRAPRPAPSALPAAPPAPPALPTVDKLMARALEGRMTREGELVNAAFTAPSL